MKNLANTETVTRKVVFEREDLREIYYRELQTARCERLKHESVEAEFKNDREARRQVLFERLGYTPKPDVDPQLQVTAAEAWMLDHPEEFNSETAPTRGAQFRLLQIERLRLKATRERLRELGVR